MTNIVSVHFQIRIPILRFRQAVVVVGRTKGLLAALGLSVLRRPHRPRRRRRRALHDPGGRASANLHKVSNRLRELNPRPENE